MTEHDEIRMAGPRLSVKVAELLRLAHRNSGLTQKEIARRLDVGEARVSQILNGDGNLHVATVARAFAAMGFDAAVKIFDGQGDELRIPRRAVRTRPQETVYHHTIQSDDGKIHTVRSWAYRAADGRHVEAPLREDEMPSLEDLELLEEMSTISTDSPRKKPRTSAATINFDMSESTSA